MTWLSGCSSLESCCQRTHAWCSQVFYRTHIIAFVAFMVFGFIHHYQLWAYTMPGEASPLSHPTPCPASPHRYHGNHSSVHCICWGFFLLSEQHAARSHDRHKRVQGMSKHGQR